MIQPQNRYNDVTIEHLLISFAKQAVNGLASQPDGLDPMSESEAIAIRAFDIAEACVNELISRLPPIEAEKNPFFDVAKVKDENL